MAISANTNYTLLAEVKRRNIYIGGEREREREVYSIANPKKKPERAFAVERERT